MARGGWQGSDRRERLPDDWPVRRRRALSRDGGRCVHRDAYGVRCDEPATDVDHIIPNDNDELTNLQSLCAWHHQGKTIREARQAQIRNRAKISRKFRRTERHPGLL